MADQDPKTAALLAPRAATAPEISKDGARLAFLSNASGVPQVHLMDPDGGNPRQLTDHEDKVALVKFAPKGGSLAYGMDDGGDERQQLYLWPDGADEPERLTDAPDVIHDWGGWSPDGTAIAYTANARDRAHFDVHVLDVATRASRCLLEGEGLRSVEGWSPDGKALVVASKRASFDVALHLLDLASGELRPLAPADEACVHRNVRWRKDGTKIYLCSNQGREFLGVAALDPQGGTLAWLHTPEHDVEQIALSPNNATLALVENHNGFSELRLLALDGGDVPALPDLPKGVFFDLKWLPDGSGLLLTAETSRQPADIWRVDLAAGRAARLTDSADTVDGAALVNAELVHFPSFDGREVPGFVYCPRGNPPDGGFPAVVLVHGGPEAQWLPRFHGYVQAFVARGWLVLAPNVRGSTGYGRSYAALDDRDKRVDSVRDLEHAGRWLHQHPIVNGERVAVMGQSYGGFMTLAALTEQPELWCAGAEFYGIGDWLTMLNDTGAWRRSHRAAEYGDPEHDRELLEAVSPLRKIDRVRVPLFVAQGLRDPRVPPNQSEQVVGALRHREHPVAYVTIPDEGHGFVKRSNRLTVYGAVLDFLDAHL